MKFKLKNYSFYLEVHLGYRANFFLSLRNCTQERCHTIYLHNFTSRKSKAYPFFPLVRQEMAVWIQSLLFSTRICKYLDANSLPSFQAD